MTFDRIPLWVAASFLSFAPAAMAIEEMPTPASSPAASEPQELSAPPQALPAFRWVAPQDAPLFDFEQIPSVLKFSEHAPKPKYHVLARAKGSAKENREIQHYARLFRVWTYESFQHDSEEYRRRIAAAENILKVWDYEGCPIDVRDALKNWFHEAALASAEGKPLPECDFVNQELLAQVEQGIELTQPGGPHAAKAIARAAVNGVFGWSLQKSVLGTALTTPLPFELPDPALIAERLHGREPELVEEVAELEITPVDEDEPVSTDDAQGAPAEQEFDLNLTIENP